MRSPEAPRSTRLRAEENPYYRHVVRLGAEAARPLIGGKADGLNRLARAGIPVAPGFVVTRHAFEEAVDQLICDVEDLAELRDALRGAELPVELVDEIAIHITELGGVDVAVRSSAIDEDGASTSFAGQHTTVLGVRTLDAVLDAVREVWAEALSEHALQYRVRMAVDSVWAPMAVVVQTMVTPDVAGVAFTIDPVAPRSGEAVVSAARGLGTAVVEGDACDTYYVERRSGYVTRSETHEDTLDSEALRELVRFMDRAERSFGEPLDLEWARVGDAFTFLQARPITATQQVEESVWTNSNVGEALPGVATPLTWSIIRRFSRRGFERAFGTLGLDVPEDTELVGSFAGRVYLNLTEFAEITSHIPILSPDALFEMAGGGGVDLVRHIYDSRDVTGFLVRLPTTVPRVLLTQATMPLFAPVWSVVFEAWCAAFFSRDLAQLPHDALARELERLDAMFDWNGEVALACASNFLMSYTVTREALRTFGRASIHGREQELLGGLHVSSADAGLALLELGRIARRSRRLRRIVIDTDPSQTLDALHDAADHEDVNLFLTEFEAFRDRFGHRAPREAELATPRWREEPRFLFEVLRGLIEAEHVPTKLEVDRDRERALAEVDRIIEQAFGAGMRRAFRAILTFTRGNARRRETLRNRVVDSLDMYRHYFLEVGERLTARGKLAQADDVFFLTVDEVREWLADASAGAEFRFRVLVRRARHELFAAEPDPPNIFVLHGNEIVGEEEYAERSTSLEGELRELRGLPASPGRVTGRARIVTDPCDAARFQPGEILVVPYADVGWTPLFLNARAIVVDLGGPLSHASIVAREYGVPAVVNTRHAVTTVRDGDLITVDGERGIVFVKE